MPQAACLLSVLLTVSISVQSRHRVPKKTVTLCLPSSGFGSSLGLAASGRGCTACAVSARGGEERRASTVTRTANEHGERGGEQQQ